MHPMIWKKQNKEKVQYIINKKGYPPIFTTIEYVCVHRSPDQAIC